MPKIYATDTRDDWLALRRQDVTSTEVAALFGHSPYMTAFELYLQKTGQVDDEIEPNERMELGLRLEPVIASYAADRNDWKIRSLNRYMRHSDAPRMGASFDYEIVASDEGPGILEVKAVDYLVFRDDWLKDEEGAKAVEAPVHIELQLQHQLEVSNREWGAIALLVGGNTLHTIKRKRDREIGVELVAAVADFWHRVGEKKPPDPDYARDAAVISRLLWDGSGPPYDARGMEDITSIVQKYQAAAEDEKGAKRRKDAAKAELLLKIGDAQKVLTDVGTVSCGTAAGGMVSYERKPFRNFRFTPRKATAQAAE